MVKIDSSIPKPGSFLKWIMRIIQLSTIVFFLFTSYEVVGNIYMNSVGKPIQGKVVSSHSVRVSTSSRSGSRRSSSSKYIYKPIIQYSLDGETYEIHGEIIGSMDTNYQMGESIDLLYLPDNPSFAVINNFMEMWLMPILKFVLVAMLFGFSVALPWIVSTVKGMIGS